MKLHADLSIRAVVQTALLPWVDSPVNGVQRKLIERDGEEVARATSLVRYAAGMQFFSHDHELGEEFLVLEGDFNDEYGSYGPGTYVKNPPGSRHTPYTVNGCTILVKLRHMDKRDLIRTVIDTTTAAWHAGTVPGLSVLPLSEFETTHTALVRWAPGTQFKPHRHFGGEEIFVLEGVFQDESGDYPAGTWIRSPHLSTHTPYSEQGCLILVKIGHLSATDNP
ncbi:cupin domain-containing protein [Undibacterium curvum]|uniref:Cupin domain-containing protein n=1 Tax=Undibacterium curvum TaxID=2762294 RepID=A0ABR7A0M4_9BURK|nr:cupin domain-containing protein [Undibacterium curvum]MBC3930276.1 cupin domain-containing protein [Undibacterium curvum]